MRHIFWTAVLACRPRRPDNCLGLMGNSDRHQEHNSFDAEYVTSESQNSLRGSSDSRASCRIAPVRCAELRRVARVCSLEGRDRRERLKCVGGRGFGTPCGGRSSIKRLIIRGQSRNQLGVRGLGPLTKF